MTLVPADLAPDRYGHSLQNLAGAISEFADRVAAETEGGITLLGTPTAGAAAALDATRLGFAEGATSVEVTVTYDPTTRHINIEVVDIREIVPDDSPFRASEWHDPFTAPWQAGMANDDWGSSDWTQGSGSGGARPRGTNLLDAIADFFTGLFGAGAESGSDSAASSASAAGVSELGDENPRGNKPTSEEDMDREEAQYVDGSEGGDADTNDDGTEVFPGDVSTDFTDVPEDTKDSDGDGIPDDEETDICYWCHGSNPTGFRWFNPDQIFVADEQMAQEVELIRRWAYQTRRIHEYWR